MNRLLILVLLFFIHPLFGQDLLPAKNLGRMINSVYDEINPILSPDGNTLYFLRINHPNNQSEQTGSQEIWYSQKDKNGDWSKAARLNSFINTSDYNAIAGFSGDGKKCIVSGWYDQKGQAYSSGFSIVDKSGKGFSNPEKMIIPGFEKLSKGGALGMSLSNSGEQLVLAGTSAYNSEKLDLYISTLKKGKWTPLKKLGDNINTKWSEEAPSFSVDGKTLYFTRVKNGNHDIYKSVRLDSGFTNWSVAEPMGKNINTGAGESYFKPYLDDNYAFFVSNGRERTMGGSDIFSVKLKEDRPYILLSGFIINSLTGRVFTSKKDFKLYINGEISDSIVFNYDSSKYEVKLPFGKTYSLKIDLKNYTSIQYDTSFINQKEFLVVKKNLYLNPIPYVQINGKILDKKTGNPVSTWHSPEIYIDTTQTDSIKIAESTGAFTVRLLLGKKHILGFRARGYNTIPDTLDLTKVEEYKEIDLFLYANPHESDNSVSFETMVTITGSVFDKKSGLAIKGKAFEVHNDQYPEIVFQGDSNSAKYHLELPAGLEYALNAKAENFYPIFENINTKGKLKQKLIKRNLYLAPIEVGQSVRMNNIFFETGKAILKKESFPELDRLTRFLKDNPNIMVEIDGHTDNNGKEDKNAHLSWLRAKAVHQYMAKKNVHAGQISFNGYGSEKPVASNKTEEGRALNRRVEFTILEIK